MRTLDTDIFTISSYDASTGEVTVTTAATGYHFGAASSTAPEYPVDMRGEVALLSRNILIDASLTDV
jgi:hypothetical protein